MGRSVVDLTGKRFGKLTVLKLWPEDFIRSDGKPLKQWLCRCDCGNEIIVTGENLRHKNHGVKSCGCTRKQKSIIGKKYGKLTVIKEYKNDNGDYRCECKCDCGNTYDVSRYPLINGKITDCPNCRPKENPNKVIDLTGQRFGRLVVLKKDSEVQISRSGKRLIKWICQCDCGRIVSVIGRKLRDGRTKSCGCLGAENLGINIDEWEKRVKNKIVNNEGKFKDLTGMRFGKLVAIEPIRERDKNGELKVKWICKCDCGNTHVVSRSNLINGHTQSCGCIDSTGEAAIGRYLKKKHIKCKKEYSFPDCRDFRPLPFDFAILNKDHSLKCVIEYDGIQHFEVVRFNGMTQERAEESFKICQLHDKMKDDYCKEHNIPLLRIRYDEFDNIEKLIDEFLEKIGDKDDGAIQAVG